MKTKHHLILPVQLETVLPIQVSLN